MSDKIKSQGRVDALNSLREFMDGYMGKTEHRVSAKKTEPVLLGEILRTEMAKLLPGTISKINE